MKMKFWAILVLLLLFIIPGCGDDSNYTVNAVTTPAPVGASTVQGTVYGADGQPVGAGITVRLTPSIASSENYGEQQTTTTNAQGFFSFTVHYAGAYLIDALNGTQLLGSQLFNITGGGQIINILLGQATGQLTVNIVPANADATVEVWPGGDITTSAASVTGSQTGEYIFYLPAGLYTVGATAAGYNELEPQSVTIAEGGEETLTFDFSTGGEVPVSSWGMDPYACINTGEVPVKYHVEDFTGTGTIDFIFKSTGEVVKTVPVDKSNLNSITLPPDYKASSYYYGGIYYYLAFTINTVGMPAGYYTVRLTHNPPVIDGSSTTTELEFYIGDTIQGALYAASETGWDVPYEIVTPWETHINDYAKVYIPAGNYQQGVSSTFPDGNLDVYDVYFQGAGAGNTIIDFYGTSNYIYLGYGVIDGFTIKNSTNEAIYTQYSDIYIYNNRIESNGYGIYNYDSYDTYIFDNIITNNTSHGIYFDDYAYNVNIGNNVISENGGGIYVAALEYNNLFITGNNIYKNTFAGAGGGIAIDNYEGDACEITGNVISENSTSDVGGGIAFYNNSSSNVNIQNNEITGNTAPGAGAVGGGIHFQGSTDFARITGNNIYGNTSGASTGNQLYVPAPATPLLNAGNNWWGTGVTVNDTEVFQVSTPGASVDAGTPATTQFPVPVVPTI